MADTDTINDLDSTMSSTDESPPEFELVRCGDAWKGGNEHFGVRHNVIKVKNSDGDPSITPTAQQRRKMYDSSGNYSQHIQLFQTDDLFQLWMNKIGPYLADWVLDKRFSNDPTARIMRWKLMNFPAGYTLWLHKTGDHTDPANPRTDAYLYGSPHKIFRSPMEFVEHAIWLMKGGGSPDSTLGCQCKYCMTGQSQRAINRRLNRGTEDDDDEDSDGAGGGRVNAAPGGATAADLNDRTRHRLFRNRPGYGASAAARRRAAKRERSPVEIKAKDYRLGNRGGSGGGGAGAGASAGGTAV